MHSVKNLQILRISFRNINVKVVILISQIYLKYSKDEETLRFKIFS